MKFKEFVSFKRWIDVKQSLLNAYASVLFSNNQWIGLWYLLISFWFPNAGISGFIGAIVGGLTASFFLLPRIASGVYSYNSLLLGLALGIAYQLDTYLVSLIVLGAMLSVFLTVVLEDWLWRIAQLPVLCLPFFIATLICFMVANAYGQLGTYVFPFVPLVSIMDNYVGDFLVSFGTIFLIPHPLAGLLLAMGLLWTSRYLAILALIGYMVGDFLLSWLLSGTSPILGQWSGFTFILLPMIIGGIYTVPGWYSLLVALIAVSIGAVITTTLQGLVELYSVPIIVLPFLLSTYVLLGMLRERITVKPPYLLLNTPSLPEHSYEHSRLMHKRGAKHGSVPLYAPFLGSWYVSQSFDEAPTHQPPWQYALDFIIIQEGSSFHNEGLDLYDYYCFDAPVLSPCYGVVVRAEDSLPDLAPGTVDSKNNWGNFLLIGLECGLYVLLAHLRQHSLFVSVGEQVVPGAQVARCGNTGRSMHPHLHLHVQKTALLGSATYPFHLLGIMQHDINRSVSQFCLISQPKTGMTLHVSQADDLFRSALHLALDSQFHYRYRLNDGEWVFTSLTVIMSVTGDLRLVSDSGASAGFVEEGGALFFFDRQGGKDLLLDIWVLAFSATPLTDIFVQWNDYPSDRLLPLSWPWRLWRNVCHPLGGGLEGHYQRKRSDSVWLQKAYHLLRLPFGMRRECNIQATIDAERGCVSIDLVTQLGTVQVELNEHF